MPRRCRGLREECCFLFEKMLKERKGLNNIVISPCCTPKLSLDEVLAVYSEIGFKKYEAFTSWAAPFDFNADPQFYAGKLKQYGMTVTSMHLPPVKDEFDATLNDAIKAAKFAAALGVEVVLFKASSRENYIKGAKPFLDAIEGLGLTPVLQNHSGSAISTLEDFKAVIEGINDPRMKTLLEVGHFHSVGVLWKEGYELLGDSIALIHIKDQIGKQSVPFDTGEVDLKGLFEHMKSVGYTGNYVVEMEVEDSENTLTYLKDALSYLEKINIGG